MTRYLITGGAGFIGVNAAAHFARRGAEVTVLDNLSRRGTPENLEWLRREHPTVRAVTADIRRDNAVLAVEVARADVILHLAAQVAVTTSVTDPRTDFEINALGAFNVLEAARRRRRCCRRKLSEALRARRKGGAPGGTAPAQTTRR